MAPYGSRQIESRRGATDRRSVAEFGGNATLTALGSYNPGAESIRRLLRARSREKGWRTAQRSYWHLYRMRPLSEEAMTTFLRLSLRRFSTNPVGDSVR
jgi:hypothetical protein